jgi:hypothetical protein
LLVAEERIGSAVLRVLWRPVSSLPVETELIPTGTTKVSGDVDPITQPRVVDQFMTHTALAGGVGAKKIEAV